MAISKWVIFEYEYSLIEFILSFIGAFVVSYFFLITFAHTFTPTTILIASAGFAVIIGLLWTYHRAQGLLGSTAGKK